MALWGGRGKDCWRREVSIGGRLWFAVFDEFTACAEDEEEEYVDEVFHIALILGISFYDNANLRYFIQKTNNEVDNLITSYEKVRKFERN